MINIDSAQPLRQNPLRAKFDQQAQPALQGTSQLILPMCLVNASLITLLECDQHDPFGKMRMRPKSTISLKMPFNQSQEHHSEWCMPFSDVSGGQSNQHNTTRASAHGEQDAHLLQPDVMPPADITVSCDAYWTVTTTFEPSCDLSTQLEPTGFSEPLTAFNVMKQSWHICPICFFKSFYQRWQSNHKGLDVSDCSIHYLRFYPPWHVPRDLPNHLLVCLLHVQVTVTQIAVAAKVHHMDLPKQQQYASPW